MKKVLLAGMILASVSSYGVEQTICFSQKASSVEYSPGNPVYLATLGDDATLNGGKCEGAKLSDMNKKGWRLIQVVTGLQSSFGMVFEKVGK